MQLIRGLLQQGASDQAYLRSRTLAPPSLRAQRFLRNNPNLGTWKVHSFVAVHHIHVLLVVANSPSKTPTIPKRHLNTIWLTQHHEEVAEVASATEAEETEAVEVEVVDEVPAVVVTSLTRRNGSQSPNLVDL